MNPCFFSIFHTCMYIIMPTVPPPSDYFLFSCIWCWYLCYCREKYWTAHHIRSSVAVWYRSCPTVASVVPEMVQRPSPGNFDRHQDCSPVVGSHSAVEECPNLGIPASSRLEVPCAPSDSPSVPYGFPCRPLELPISTENYTAQLQLFSTILIVKKNVVFWVQKTGSGERKLINNLNLQKLGP